jgi:hypothetical protein
LEGDVSDAVLEALRAQDETQLRLAIEQRASAARNSRMTVERVLIEIKLVFERWHPDTGGPLEWRELRDRAVSWAINAYYEARPGERRAQQTEQRA